MHQAVIKPELVSNGGRPTESKFDIDERENKSFPNFILKNQNSFELT